MVPFRVSLADIGRTKGMVDVIQVCHPFSEGGRWFRFKDFCWVTASDSPVLRMNSRFANKMTFESIENRQIKVISQVSISVTR